MLRPSPFDEVWWQHIKLIAHQQNCEIAAEDRLSFRGKPRSWKSRRAESAATRQMREPAYSPQPGQGLGGAFVYWNGQYFRAQVWRSHIT
jgi:hypothetical protein